MLGLVSRPPGLVSHNTERAVDLRGEFPGAGDGVCVTVDIAGVVERDAGLDDAGGDVTAVDRVDGLFPACGEEGALEAPTERDLPVGVVVGGPQIGVFGARAGREPGKYCLRQGRFSFALQVVRRPARVLRGFQGAFAYLVGGSAGQPYEDHLGGVADERRRLCDPLPEIMYHSRPDARSWWLLVGEEGGVQPFLQVVDHFAGLGLHSVDFA